ncbi:SDR family oxidoreductase [Pedobacter sp. AW1-32]|uniref:SDR family oxidoreductase n=1 Tax=Pedobacter sp. AW1-32 TaxID=3383026 RepID=UPI003FF021B5
MQKTIFITGSSSGLGKATAILFQQNGWKVIATMRNPEAETELNHLENVHLLPLDVTKPEQINACVEQACRLEKIDVVFNNAGYGMLGVMEAFSDEDITRQIETNLLGPIRVTQAFIPHFRQNGGGIFLTTTSLGGFVGFPLCGVYNATKFGIEGWTEGMSYELAPHHIQIKTIAPGAITTDFSGRSLDKKKHDAYHTVEEKVFNFIDSMHDEGASPEQIAQIVYEAATDGKDQVSYLAGKDALATFDRKLQIGSETLRKEMAKQIFG